MESAAFPIPSTGQGVIILSHRQAWPVLGRTPQPEGDIEMTRATGGCEILNRRAVQAVRRLWEDQRRLWWSRRVLDTDVVLRDLACTIFEVGQILGLSRSEIGRILREADARFETEVDVYETDFRHSRGEGQ